MGLITLTAIANGNAGDATVVQNDFTTIANEINGNLDNANIKTAAAIAFSKLDVSNLTARLLMLSGVHKGAFGTSGAEWPAVPIRTTSAGNKFAVVFIPYPIPFKSAPTLAITLSALYVDASNGDVSGSTTTQTGHQTDADGRYVGFMAGFLNNANFTSNTHVTPVFSWTATV